MNRCSCNKGHLTVQRISSLLVAALCSKHWVSTVMSRVRSTPAAATFSFLVHFHMGWSKSPLLVATGSVGRCFHLPRGSEVLGTYYLFLRFTFTKIFSLSKLKSLLLFLISLKNLKFKKKQNRRFVKLSRICRCILPQLKTLSAWLSCLNTTTRVSSSFLKTWHS